MEKQSNPKAFIFDLDGVITQTQDLHKKAWLKMFNEFLEDRRRTATETQEQLEDFRVWEDYDLYLDGKPREEGIKSFLSSRRISLSDEKIKSLALKKNDFYLDLLETHGPGLIEESHSFILRLSDKKIPMAIVSSSRNCRLILKMTHLLGLFKVIVDPLEADPLRLKGKPSPDYFLEASKRLGISPAECYLVEDALSGVEAGKAGGFGRVIGIKVIGRVKALERLKSAGADEVVSSLWDIQGIIELIDLPDALSCSSKLLIHAEKFFLFLDFDGTISQIVENPSEAKLLDGVRELIAQISRFLPICVITGRDTSVIKTLIGLPGIYYVACHGFEMTGPHHLAYALDKAKELIPELQRAKTDLAKALGHIYGVIIEQKTFGVAVHYRMVKDRGLIPQIRRIVDHYVMEQQKLKVKPGEEVLELLPAISWDKGKALLKLYEVLELDRSLYPPLYFGDGKTDEDAFKLIREEGISILVSRKLRATFARFRIKGPEDTRQFLKILLKHLEAK